METMKRYQVLKDKVRDRKQAFVTLMDFVEKETKN